MPTDLARRTGTARPEARRPGGVLSRIFRNPWWGWGTAMALLAALIAVATRGVLEPRSLPSLRFDVTLDGGHSFGGTNTVLVTPDGGTIITSAVVDQRPVLIARHLDSAESHIIEGSAGAERPFVSADGELLGFVVNGKLIKLPVRGGTPIPFANSSWGGGAWNRDGRVVFTNAHPDGLWIVNESGDGERRLTSPDTLKGELGHWSPQWMPDGKSILFTAYRTPISKTTIEILDIESGTRRVILEGAVMAKALPTGHLLFAREAAVLAVPFDLRRLEVSGTPAVAIEGVAMNVSEGLASWDVSPNGTLAYLAGRSGEFADSLAAAQVQPRIHVVTNWFAELRRK